MGLYSCETTLHGRQLLGILLFMSIVISVPSLAASTHFYGFELGLLLQRWYLVFPIFIPCPQN